MPRKSRWKCWDKECAFNNIRNDSALKCELRIEIGVQRFSFGIGVQRFSFGR
ncbi:MAG: hypothetical protein KAI83_08710 [Thiomargarita sp.]|nr:hypothetical protein [Thiomargarita sp.]